MSYTFKENENAVWCLGNAILASLSSSKCSHFFLPIEVIDILCELHMSCLVIPDFERDYCAQVYSSYIVDIIYMLLYFM